MFGIPSPVLETMFPLWGRVLEGTEITKAGRMPNQNLQIIGVTNVVISQAMTAIPLPMER